MAPCSPPGAVSQVGPDKQCSVEQRNCPQGIAVGGELIGHPAIEHDQHLSHAGRRRHFGRLAAVRQPAIELTGFGLPAAPVQHMLAQRSATGSGFPTRGARVSAK
jgi:hypothetical protein